MELTCETLAWLAVAIGVILRVWEYLEFRPIYLDEKSLWKNVANRAIFDFHHVLEEDQMAPPGFLVVERLLSRLPLDMKAAGRLFPFLCGITSVFLTRSAARRFLDRRAVPLAVGLLALADHLLYYSAEIKQYSCDLVMALAGLLLAAPQPPEKTSDRQLVTLAIFGVVAPWFSFTVVFVLSGVGLHLLVTQALRKDWRKAALTASACGTWLISFAGCYLLSKSIMSQRDFLWVWWNFAFLPVPPRSLADASLVVESIANVFINPTSLLSPFTLPYTALLAAMLALFGCLSVGRRWPGGLFLLISPFILTLAASGLHLYPFHGRLLFVLVPTFLFLPSEGVTAVGRHTGWLATLTLAGCFLYGEAAEVLWHKAVQKRSRTFDSHGDLKNDLLDYLEYQRRRPLIRKTGGQSGRRVLNVILSMDPVNAKSPSVLYAALTGEIESRPTSNGSIPWRGIPFIVSPRATSFPATKSLTTPPLLIVLPLGVPFEPNTSSTVNLPRGRTSSATMS
jgi:hypothetical protein